MHKADGSACIDSIYSFDFCCPHRAKLQKEKFRITKIKSLRTMLGQRVYFAATYFICVVIFFQSRKNPPILHQPWDGTRWGLGTKPWTSKVRLALNLLAENISPQLRALQAFSKDGWNSKYGKRHFTNYCRFGLLFLSRFLAQEVLVAGQSVIPQIGCVIRIILHLMNKIECLAWNNVQR